MSSAREIYVKVNPSADRTESGIIIPDTLVAKYGDNTGIVVAVSSGTANEPMTIKKGDEVKFDPHAGRMINLLGAELKLLVDTDVYCVLKKSIFI